MSFARATQLCATLAIVTLVSTGCSGSPHPTGPPRIASTPRTIGSATAQDCSAAQGRLVPSESRSRPGLPYSHAPITLDHRLIQAFGYVNLGAPCYERGFPVIRLYDGGHRPLNVRQVDGNIILGTAEATRYLLQRNDDSSGFNIETSMSGSCVTVRYVSASFGNGTTPLATVNYRVCGRLLYVTTLFR